MAFKGKYWMDVEKYMIEHPEPITAFELIRILKLGCYNIVYAWLAHQKRLGYARSEVCLIPGVLRNGCPKKTVKWQLLGARMKNPAEHLAKRDALMGVSK